MMIAISKIYDKWLYSTKLRHKIMVTYLVLIIFPLGIFQFAASDKISQMIINQVTYSAEQGFDQTYSYLSYRVQRIAKTTDVLVANPTVYNVILNPQNNDDINKQMKDYAELKQLMISVRDTLDIYRVVLYVPESFFFARESESFLPIGLTKKNPCFDRLIEEKTKYMWCTPDKLLMEEQTKGVSFISVVRNILDPNDYLKPISQLRVDVETGKLIQILQKANVVKNSVSFLYDNENGVILSSDQTDDSLIEPLSDLQQRDETISFTRNELYYLVHPVPFSQWSMVTVIPLNEVVKQSDLLRNQLYLLLIAIAVAAYFIAYLLAISVTRRISRLTARIRTVESGQMPVISPIQGNDEIGELIRTYNYMIKKISAMNELQYQLGQERKGAELKALQSQINPHFLYNTLDLINWMAKRGMNDEIQNVVKTLARFYKVSLSSGRDIITIGEELDHVSFYVQIQNIRYDHKIVLRLEVPDDILHFTIPKITLQPIVENAILHGILGRENREGTIVVTAVKTGNDIRITVKDDGVGMNEAKLAEIVLGISGQRDGSSSYGCKNVALRIRHYFGDDYGLSFSSREGEGTEVEIMIPASQNTGE